MGISSRREWIGPCIIGYGVWLLVVAWALAPLWWASQWVWVGAAILPFALGAVAAVLYGLAQLASNLAYDLGPPLSRRVGEVSYHLGTQLERLTLKWMMRSLRLASDEEGEPFYDNARPDCYVATRSLTVYPQYGAKSVSILVPRGLKAKHSRWGIGHNHIQHN
jgi:hypothetical protein